MNFWEHVSRRFGHSTAVERQAALCRAYRAVFLGNPDRSQQQIVLSDLQHRCGWNKITDPKYASDRELWFAEGKRAAYGELFAHLSLSPADVEALNNAARVDAVYDNQDA